MSSGFGVYVCVPLKSFLMFCNLLRWNATKSSARCWSDVDSGSDFCLFGPVFSVTMLYSFLLYVLFVFTKSCLKSHFLYLRIVTNLFHSFLNALECCFFLYLIHFHFLWFLGLHHIKVFGVYWLLFLLWLGQLS